MLGWGFDLGVWEFGVLRGGGGEGKGGCGGGSGG